MDVKHHVYLLTRDGTYLLPGADPPVYVRAASTLYCFHSFISRLPCQTFRMVLTASMDRRHGDKECLFGGRITSYGRVWRKVSESDAWNEALTQTPVTGLRHPSSNHCHNWLGRCRKAMLGVWHWPGSLPEGFVPPWPRWLCSGCVALPWCRWWHTSSGSVQTFLPSSCWPAWWRYNCLVMWPLWPLGLLRCYMLSILSITPSQSPQLGWSVSSDTNCLIYIYMTPHLGGFRWPWYRLSVQSIVMFHSFTIIVGGFRCYRPSISSITPSWVVSGDTDCVSYWWSLFTTVLGGFM